MTNKSLIAALALSTAAIFAAPITGFADEDDKLDMTGVVFNIQDAISIALDRVPGTVIEAELEAEDGMTSWEISVMDENEQVMEIEIDANSGVVLEVEEDD